MTPELSLLIPALNEQQNLRPLVEKLGRLLTALGWEAEILLIDDCSDDETFREALLLEQSSPRVRALHKGLPRGIGHAIRTGIAQARGRWGVVIMGDGVDPLDLLPAMRTQMINDDRQLVLVSRYQRPEDAATIPALYRFYQWGYRCCCRYGLGIPLRDTTYAFRAFDLEFIRGLGLRSVGFEISPEITIKAWQAGARIGQVAGQQGRRTAGESKFLFTRTGWGYARVLAEGLLYRAQHVIAHSPTAHAWGEQRTDLLKTSLSDYHDAPPAPQGAGTPASISRDAHIMHDPSTSRT